MSSVDLYDVLNLDSTATKKDIKHAYRELVKKFHPDKPGGDAEMFEFVTHAYEVLHNQESREQYDRLHKLSNESSTSHASLREQAKSYLDAQDNDVSKKTKEQSSKEFAAAFDEMDKKHNYKRGVDDDNLDTKVAKRRLDDMELAREQDDIEFSHDQIFDNGQFSLAKFNAAFDAMHGGPTDLVPHEGAPAAWSAPSGVGGMGTNYSSLDSHGELYVEDDDHLGVEGQNFSSINFPGSADPKKKLSKRDIKKLKSADYTANHNSIPKDYERSLLDRIAERERETEQYKNREMGDFDTDPSCGGYGVFHSLGVDIDKVSSITWDNEESIDERYQKLLKMRKEQAE